MAVTSFDPTHGPPARRTPQALRTAVQLSIQPLQVPVYNGLAHVFACRPGESWAPSMPCLGAQHLALVVIGALLLAMYGVLTFVGKRPTLP